MISVLAGLAGLLVLAVSMVAAAAWGTRLAARWLGVPRFRWFDTRPAEASLWRRAGVRLLGGIAPLGVCCILFFVASLVEGKNVPTTRVKVLDGPAQTAGVLDGDRVVSIDGRPIETWEALRAAVRERQGERRLEIERSGMRKVVLVTPTTKGVIGVITIEQREPIGVTEALVVSVQAPWKVGRALIRTAVPTSDTRVELTGPVGILRGSEARSGSYLMLLAILGSTYWPILFGVHLFDTATLALFLRTHPTGPPGDERAERHRRLRRLRQALVISLACLLVLGAGQIASSVEGDIPPGFATLVVLVLPGATAHYPLTWLLANEVRSRGQAALLLAACIVVPCAGLAVGIWLVVRAARELAPASP